MVAICLNLPASMHLSTFDAKWRVLTEHASLVLCCLFDRQRSTAVKLHCTTQIRSPSAGFQAGPSFPTFS